MKSRKLRKAMTWGDVAELMERIARRADQESETHRKMAMMHRQLAHDLRALLRGKLMPV